MLSAENLAEIRADGERIWSLLVASSRPGPSIPRLGHGRSGSTSGLDPRPDHADMPGAPR